LYLGSQHTTLSACCCALALAANYRSTSAAGKPAAHRCCYRPTGQTDGQTDIDAYRYKRAASCNSNTQITKQRLLLLPLSVVSAIDSALSDRYETSAIAQ